MGIYIKGMKMPTNRPMWIVVHPDGTVEASEVSQARHVGWRTLQNAAIPVPDHGALIERDKILDVWKSDPHPASMKTLVQAIWKTPIVLQADSAKDINVPDKEEA